MILVLKQVKLQYKSYDSSTILEIYSYDKNVDIVAGTVRTKLTLNPAQSESTPSFFIY